MMRVLLLILASLGPAYAQTARVDGVRIVERGIYVAESGSLDPMTRVKRVSGARLLRATTNIPARLGVRFGLRYALQGSPVGAKAPIEIVRRYPQPGLPRDGKLVTEHRHSMQIGIGVPQYADFQFDEPDELVPGIWVIELWSTGRKLGEQQFCVGGADNWRHPSCVDELS